MNNNITENEENNILEKTNESVGQDKNKCKHIISYIIICLGILCIIANNIFVYWNDKINILIIGSISGLLTSFFGIFLMFVENKIYATKNKLSNQKYMNEKLIDEISKLQNEQSKIDMLEKLMDAENIKE